MKLSFEQEVAERVMWIRDIMSKSGAKGIVFGNSGGKDCTLVGILCKMAIPNVISLVMPCESSINYNEDKDHASKMTLQYKIDSVEIDLTDIKRAFRLALDGIVSESDTMALANINPRLRMTALYSYAYKHNYLVAGTGNLSERTMGYFTKFGDGAFDFNPIGNLTVTEVYSFLRYLKAPNDIIDKAPSAGLYEGQTDEAEMGISYTDIDEYIRNKKGTTENIAKVERAIKRSAHKRAPLLVYPNVICD